LKQYPDVKVTVFAVWQPMLPTDVAAPTSRTLARLSDPRVRQYWDPDHLLAKQLKSDARTPQPEPECCTRNGILWDLMGIYPKGEPWTERIPVASIFNGTVVDVAEGLKNTLAGK
jgi:hypothetical protein